MRYSVERGMFDVLRYRGLSYGFYLTVIVVFVCAFFYRGGFNYSVDFTGGTEIIFRFDKPVKLQAIKDVLQKEKCMGRSYEVLCCLYATSPLRDYTDIVNTMELVISNKCKQAMAVTNFDLPAFQAMFYSADGSLTPMRPDLLQLNSNEVEEIVVDNGSTYVTRVKDFILSGSLVSDGMLGYQMPKVRSIDIDTKEDFILAEYYSDATYQ